MTKNSDDWFARYRFCQPLGQGGMGTVYLAEDKEKGSAQCVVKQLISKSSDQSENDEAIRLFKREVDMLSTLQHRGIVRFFDYHITDDGKYFLVMDYVQGRNLESIITSRPFDSEGTVEIAIQCCEVLEFLHEQNPPVIYRDLKPSNLMLTPEGEIVFIDFGIARTFMPKQAATRVVTAGYSPPEQYFGRPETRSDLYALGATMGHLLTGQRPKPLSTSSPRLIRHDVLMTLDDLVKRLTAHNPEDRPGSARQVRYELYRIYQEIHHDFEVPEEAAAALNKPTVARNYLGSSAFKERNAAVDKTSQEGMGRFATDNNRPIEHKEYDSHDLRSLHMNHASSVGKKLNSRMGFIQRIKEWLSIKFS